MAIRGTKPKPIALKILEGNPGRRPLPQPANWSARPPKMPKDLAAAAKTEWRRVVPVLVRLGVVNELDRRALADYCTCCAALDECERILADKGLLVEGGAGLMKNPAAQLAREYRAMLLRWSAEFGLTASSRARMNLPDRADQGLDELLG